MIVLIFVAYTVDVVYSAGFSMVAVVRTTAEEVRVFVLCFVRVFVHLMLVELAHGDVELYSRASATVRKVVTAARAEKANERILKDK